MPRTPQTDPTRRRTRVSRLLDRVVKQRRADAEAEVDRPVDPELRLAAIEQRLHHLEAMVEGLQDSVHRESTRRQKDIDALDKKTDAGEMARQLSRHTRERGL